MILPQRELVHAENLWGGDHRPGGAADHPQPCVATHRQAEVPAQPHPGRPTEGEAQGQKACGQPQGPPRPRHDDPGQSFREDAAGAGRMAAEELADTEPPRDPIVTPREIGKRPAVTTIGVPSGGLTGWASGGCLGGRDREDDLGLRFINAPGVQLERGGLGQ
jgi:hypothetical protein